MAPGDRVDFVVQADGTVIVEPAIQGVTPLKGLLRATRRRPGAAAGCAHTLTFDRSLKRNDPFDTPIAPDGHLVPDALVEPKGILCCHAPIALLMNWKPETKK